MKKGTKNVNGGKVLPPSIHLSISWTSAHAAKQAFLSIKMEESLGPATTHSQEPTAGSTSSALGSNGQENNTGSSKEKNYGDNGMARYESVD